MIFQILIYCVYVFFHFNIAHLNIVPSSDNKLKEFKNHSIKMLDNFSLEATRTPKDIADLELSGSELICGIRPLVLHKKCLDPAKTWIRIILICIHNIAKELRPSSLVTRTVH